MTVGPGPTHVIHIEIPVFGAAADAHAAAVMREIVGAGRGGSEIAMAAQRIWLADADGTFLMEMEEAAPASGAGDDHYRRAQALTDRLMEHICGWPGEAEVFSVASVLVLHPGLAYTCWRQGAESDPPATKGALDG